MAVRAVVFDVGGVLEVVGPMDFGRRWEAELGLPPGRVDELLSDVWAAGAVGTVTEDAVRVAVGERLGITRDRVDALMAVLWRQYLGEANTELIEYVGGLRPRYRTGILSNSFVGAREREQAAYGFGDLVAEFVYSHEIGVAKPDPRSYTLTCDRLAVAADEVLFVDDVPGHVEAAETAGLHGVHHRTNADTSTRLTALLGQ